MSYLGFVLGPRKHKKSPVTNLVTGLFEVNLELPNVGQGGGGGLNFVVVVEEFLDRVILAGQ